MAIERARGHYSEMVRGSHPGSVVEDEQEERNRMKRRWMMGMISCLMTLLAWPSRPQAADSDALINLLIKKGIITQEELTKDANELASTQDPSS